VKGGTKLLLEHDVELAQKGNQEAFIRLIRNCEKTMYRVSKSYLKSDEDCTDAAQEAILKAYSSITSLKEPRFFKTWLIRILINECKRILINNKRVVPLNESNEQAESTNPYQNLEIREAIDLLDDEFRIVIILYYFEQLTSKEIAQSLQISEGTVKSRLHRARSKLAKILRLHVSRGASHE
jgi:RNA polymerase sigma factor (sigma-70 family)